MSIVNNCFKDIHSLFNRLPWELSEFHIPNRANVNMYEKNGELNVEVPVPNMTEKDVDVKLEEDDGRYFLKIQASKTKNEEGSEEDGRTWYHKASYDREYSIALPKNIDIEREPKATCENGALKIIFKIKGSDLQINGGKRIEVSGPSL